MLSLLDRLIGLFTIASLGGIALFWMFNLPILTGFLALALYIIASPFILIYKLIARKA